MERGSEEFEKRLIGTTGGDDTPQPESHDSEEMECVSDHQTDDEDYGSEWEDGSLHSFPEDLVNGVSVEFDVLPGSAKRKLIRRATAEEKVDSIIWLSIHDYFWRGQFCWLHSDTILFCDRNSLSLCTKLICFAYWEGEG